MSNLEIYKTASGVQLEIKFEDETVWANQKQIAEIFQTTPQNITLHLKKIYAVGEVEMISTCKKYLQVQIEGKRSVEREQIFYNLGAILSVGYRINSIRGTQFRQWATQRLKDYLVQGYAINEKRLKEANSKLQDLQKAITLAVKAGDIITLS